MPDALFTEPGLAALYDVLEGERQDLDAYVELARRLGARSVLDVGCGTGTLACRLAENGHEVTAIDPAAASLAIARRKPFAERVRWLHGDARSLPPLRLDLATMTGNVAQVFLTDAEWSRVLRRLRIALVPRGRLVFEVRDPAAEAWRGWTPDRTRRVVELPRGRQVETWSEVTGIDGELVAFRTTFVFGPQGDVATSNSTLRFRRRDEIEASLVAEGYVVEEVRDAPDRPALELVFVARASAGGRVSPFEPAAPGSPRRRGAG